MAVTVIFWLIFLFLPLAKPSSTQQSLSDVLFSLGKLIGFFEKDYSNLNIDGLYGLRVLEGHLEGVLQQHLSGGLGHLALSVISRVKRMKQKATAVCDKAVQIVKHDNPEYYKQMKYVVGSPWNIFETTRHQVNMSQAWSTDVYVNAKKSGITVDEETSDHCMSELIGSHKSGGVPCDISNQCVSTMTKPGLLGYGLTHQILWTMLSEKTGCKFVLEKKLQELNRGSLAHLREELCSNNYIQVIKTLEKLDNNIILPDLQDLFLEELFICPSLGFYEFLSLDYLPQILSWQMHSGCFGDEDKHRVQAVGNKLHKLKENDKKNLQQKDATPFNLDRFLGDVKNQNIKRNVTNYQVPLLKKGPNPLIYQNGKQSVNIGRKLLVEKQMTGGCLSHKTGVASGALVLYLRYLCDPQSDIIFTSHTVIPSNNDKNVLNKTDTLHYKANTNQVKKPNLVNNDIKVDETVHQIQAPKLKRHVAGQQIAYDNNALAANNNRSAEVAAAEEKKSDKDREVDDAKDYNFDEDNDDDDYDEEEDGEYDDYSKYKRADGDNDKGEGYYDAADKDMKPDYPVVNMANNQQEVGKIINADNNDNNEYKDGNDGFNDADDNVDDVDDDGKDNEDDPDYNEEDQYDRNPHPHINARNIGHVKHEYGDNVDGTVDKSVKHVREFKYDDEEEDDYEYDDDHDEIEIRRKQELKQDSQQPKADKQLEGGTRPSNSISPSTAFFVFAISIVIVLLLMYRFIKKRRIRIRFNSKHFHV